MLLTHTHMYTYTSTCVHTCFLIVILPVQLSRYIEAGRVGRPSTNKHRKNFFFFMFGIEQSTLYLQAYCFATSVEALISTLTAAEEIGRWLIINRKLLLVNINKEQGTKLLSQHLFSQITTNHDHEPLKNAPLW